MRYRREKYKAQDARAYSLQKARDRLGVASAAEAEVLIERLGEQRERLDGKLAYIQLMKDKQQSFRQEALRLTKDPSNKVKLFGLISLGLSSEVRQQIDQLRAKADAYDDECPENLNGYSGKSLYAWSCALEAQRSQVQTDLNAANQILSAFRGEANRAVAAERRIEENRRKEEARRKREEQIARKAALAQAHLKSMRDEASAVKARLKITYDCPYCGGPLGTNRHADHIYPVSKGGLSVDSNMVWVCQTCNSKKSAMTLNQFVERYRLDKALIFERLARLKKDF